MKRASLFLPLLLLGLYVQAQQPTSSASASRRLALVIGNAQYLNGNPLCNPIKDADGVAAVLKNVLHFDDVQTIKNADLKMMQDAARTFVRKIHAGDFAVFYFAGHGAQVKAQNYLIPVDFDGHDELSLEDGGYPADRIQHIMEDAGAGIRILILDACSDNPFLGKRGGVLGLNVMGGGEGTLIAFAASPGKTADDNCSGTNGLYTERLLISLQKRDLTIWQVFTETQKAVYTASNKKQLPWISAGFIDEASKFDGEFQPPPRGPCSLTDDIALWNSVKDSGSPDLVKEYLSRCANGVFTATARALRNRLEAPQPAGPAPPSPGQRPSDLILRLYGSNTIGSEAAPAQAAEFMKELGVRDPRKIPLAADEFEVEGETAGGKVIIEIKAHGSATGFKCLSSGSCDVALSSRKIKTKDVVGDLASEGDMTSPEHEHVIGLDGITVLVNQSNNVESLTLGQLRDVFSGKAQYWDQVGGNTHHRIVLFARDENSGTWEIFQDLVLNGAPLSSQAHRLEDSRQLSDLVAFDPDAIGFAGLPFVLKAKAIAVNGVFPSKFTIATREYPLSRELYFYTKDQSRNSYVPRFVSFAKSKEGQRIIEVAKFVGLNLLPDCGDRKAGLYGRLTAGACRLPVTFTFRFADFKLDNPRLDNRGRDDVMRLRSFLSEPGNAGYKIIFVGHTDNVGSADHNHSLSIKRARRIAQMVLGSHNNATVLGFGYDYPVVLDDTDEGRARNRRVDVWIRR
jgi:phosphate transport system substrate-binding protein